jgi:type III secretory pathway component EscT
MKVMMIVWTAALSIAYLVAGRSFEQALLAGKIVLIGFVLGFVGSKLCAALHAFRDAKTALSNHRR